MNESIIEQREQKLREALEACWIELELTRHSWNLLVRNNGIISDSWRSESYKRAEALAHAALAQTDQAALESEAPTTQDAATVQGLEATLWVIEQIVSDDFCEDLEMRTMETTPEDSKLTGDLKTCEEKIGKIYMIAHSALRAHSCYSAHDSWRQLRDELLANGEQLTPAPSPQSTMGQPNEETGSALVSEILNVRNQIPMFASWTVVRHPSTGADVWLRDYLMELAARIDLLTSSHATKPAESGPQPLGQSPSVASEQPSQDTERLDWLEKNRPLVEKDLCAGTIMLYGNDNSGEGETFRAAIDSAMSVSREKKGTEDQ